MRSSIPWPRCYLSSRIFSANLTGSASSDSALATSGPRATSKVSTDHGHPLSAVAPFFFFQVTSRGTHDVSSLRSASSGSSARTFPGKASGLFPEANSDVRIYVSILPRRVLSHARGYGPDCCVRDYRASRAVYHGPRHLNHPLSPLQAPSGPFSTLQSPSRAGRMGARWQWSRGDDSDRLHCSHRFNRYSLSGPGISRPVGCLLLFTVASPDNQRVLSVGERARGFPLCDRYWERTRSLTSAIN
jgi:hypothetical protein